MARSEEVKSKVTEGTSALFLLTDNAVGDRVVAEMKNWPKFEIVSTNLSQEQEAQLRAEFGKAETTASVKQHRTGEHL